jgi:rhodanese-related sulfurtransferase
MENLFVFITHQWLLISLFVLLIITIIWYETHAKVNGLARIDANQAIHLINKKEAVIIDTRERSVFEKGHIAYALNLTTAQLDTYNADKLKNKPVILVCQTGNSAPRLGKKLKARGIHQIYFLQGGMAAWHNANLPVRKK